MKFGKRYKFKSIDSIYFYENMGNDKEFRVNEYLTLKLERGTTNIYVKGKLFRRCSFILLNSTVEKISYFDEIESVDDNIDKLEKVDQYIQKNREKVLEIPLDTQFWGHCSNLQVWGEYDYDSRLLHKNLAFPLLKRLTEEGDPTAINVFKSEVVKRLVEGNTTVVTYLLFDGYLNLFSRDELNEELSKFNLEETNELVFALLKKGIDYLIEDYYYLEDSYNEIERITYFLIFRTPKNLDNFFEKYFTQFNDEQKQAILSYFLVDKNEIHQKHFKIIKQHLQNVNWTKIGRILLESYISHANGRYIENIRINERTIESLDDMGIKFSQTFASCIRDYLESIIKSDYKILFEEELTFNFFGVILENNPQILLNFFINYFPELESEFQYLFMALFLVNKESNLISLDFLREQFEKMDPVYLSETLGKVRWHSDQEYVNVESLKKLGELGVKIVLYVLTRDFRYQFDEGASEFWEHYADMLNKIGKGYGALIKKEAFNVFLKENRDDFERRFNHYHHKDAMYGVWVWYLLRMLEKDDIMDLLFDPRLRIFEQIDVSPYIEKYGITEEDRYKKSTGDKVFTEEQVLETISKEWKSESIIIDELQISSELQLNFLLDTLWKLLNEEKVLTDVLATERNWKLLLTETDSLFKTKFRHMQISREEKRVLEELEHITGRFFMIVGPSTGVLERHASRIEVYIEQGIVTEIGIYDIKLNEFPSIIQDLRHLRELSLIGNQLKKLPLNLINLHQLKRLCLSDNLFSVLPENIGSLISLEHLIINNLPPIEENFGILQPIRIRRLPDSIGNLKSLKTLNLLGNHLEILPSSIGDLASLEELNIGLNYIEKLPDSIGNLKNLKKLSLNNNLLSSLPETMKNLDSLEQISLVNNPRKLRDTSIRREKLNIPDWLIMLKSLKKINVEKLKS